MLLAFVLIASPAIFAQSQNAESHTEWITRSLKEMQSVKVGMSRAELLEVFKEEGGLSNRLQRRYVYRDCPYIKVDVEFEPVEAKTDGHEYPTDQIISISKPFLEWGIVD
jgi:hypothetical protein